MTLDSNSHGDKPTWVTCSDDSRRFTAYTTAMTDPVSSVRNLGPAYQTSCARAGIHSAQALHALGPDEAYSMLLKTGMKPHFIGYYVLVMGLQGRPWNDCKGDEKKALRVRFDAIKARSFDQELSDFEAALDAIGVIERR